MNKGRRYFTTKQKRSFDCGITCMINILQYYGKAVTRGDFKELLGNDRVKKNGASMWDLINSINEYGLLAEGAICDIAMLAKDNRPAIMVVEVIPKVSHYIIAYKVDETSIIVADPSIWTPRIAKMSLRKFAKRYHWRGETILIF